MSIASRARASLSPRCLFRKGCTSSTTSPPRLRLKLLRGHRYIRQYPVNVRTVSVFYRHHHHLHRIVSFSSSILLVALLLLTLKGKTFFLLLLLSPN